MDRAVTLRLRTSPDDAAIVALHNRQEADSAPLTVERYREEFAERGSDPRGERWVAVQGERLLGVGSFSPAWWTRRPDVYSVEVRVEESRWRQGIGTALHDQLLPRLLSRQATRLQAWVRADADPGRRFAARHAFRETGEVVDEYRLYVPEATTDDAERRAADLRRAGLRILSLAELGRDDERFLRALQGLWADSGAEPPDPERLRAFFPTWQREVLYAPGLSPETHWLALDGERPVGMTFLKRLSEDAAENDYTGVASTHRGRGIAPALKLRAITWAKEHGVAWFYTSSEVGNAPMISINRRLGYRQGVRRLEVARDLS